MISLTRSIGYYTKYTIIIWSLSSKTLKYPQFFVKMDLLKTFLSILFPEHCLSCGKNDVTLCPPCSLKLPRGFSPDKNTLVMLDYSSRRVKRAIWLLKYRNKRALAKIFASLLHDSLLEELAELRLMKNFTRPILMPIPISKKRFRERGYNQAGLVAEELVLISDKSSFTLAANILVKSKDTPSQVKTASRRERLKNLENSFSVADEKAVRGRNIILLDDVITTGATLVEARKVLKRAGAKQILSVAMAH